MSRPLRTWLGSFALAIAMVLADTVASLGPMPSFLSVAEARVGRPATPRSVAGVARRTTRRVVRRSTIYVGSLPAGCARTSVNGVVVWRCGGSYYQAYSGRYVVVYID